METTQAKMFVRSLSNSATKILVAFILARTALDVKDLHEWTGMKRETLYSGLELLRSCGMVERQIGEHGRQIWIPAGDFLPGVFQMSEKRTPALQMSETGTPDPLIVGGGDSKLINLTPPITTLQLSEKRTAEQGGRSVASLLRHTHLLFDGSFVNSKGLELCDPETVLAWCAYAFQEFGRGRSDRPAGLVRRKLLDLEPAPEPMLTGWIRILPEDYLEAIGEIEYTCTFCPTTFTQRTALDEHTHQRHPYICEECRTPVAFETQALWQAHYQATHEAYGQPSASQVIEIPAPDGTLATLWQTVLGELQQTMPRASFETWVQGTQALRYDGNALVIGTRNAYARDWLAGRLTRTIERLLIGIADRADLTVRFETIGVPA